MGTDPLPLDPRIAEALASVSTATLTTVLLKKGLRNVWLRGSRPLAPGQPRVVGHAYTLRFVDAPDAALPLPDASVIVSRGPFTLAGDLELMRSHGIEWIVARNAGGNGARAKIDAARELGLPLVMIARPDLPERPRTESIEDVLAFLGHDARLGA